MLLYTNHVSGPVKQILKAKPKRIKLFLSNLTTAHNKAQELGIWKYSEPNMYNS